MALMTSVSYARRSDGRALKNHRYSSSRRFPYTTDTITHSSMMMRTALFQSARCASRLAVRTRLPTSRAIAPCFTIKSSHIIPSTTFQASRWYSAPAGLSQQEVEGRIMDLLKNFDKV